MAAPQPTTHDDDADFLGVSRSITGQRWTDRCADERAALALAQRLGTPDIVARMLAGRGVGLDDAERFLSPSLRDMLPDPSILRDMDVAAERLASAVRLGQKIVVFGDYDVDGATSTALLLRYLRAVGGNVGLYIPDRLEEGYGPNAPALRRLREGGATVAVTVDCGTTAFEALEAARGAGLAVIVIDHHAAEPALPPAAAVVNPNRLDDSSALGDLAAVGVSFLLAVAVNRTLRGVGWFARGRAEPDLLRSLDLVALGTVCDVVKLRGLNRALVAQGLKVMAQRRNIGLTALADIAGLDEAPDTYHAGFLLGPRLNAGGRVGQSDLGARLLCCDDPALARELATRLDGYNRERQRIEQEVQREAMAQIEAEVDRLGAPPPLLFAAAEGWHPGVVGIVAGRIKDRWRRPAVVLSLEEERSKGSARSVPGVDIGAVTIGARQAGLLIGGGGHAMAAGLTVETARVAEARAWMTERVADRCAGIDLSPRLEIDGALAPGGCTRELVELLESAGPFGAGNPWPRLALANVRVGRAAPMGRDRNHLRCVLSAAAGGAGVKAAAFRCFEETQRGEAPLGEALLCAGGRLANVAGRLKRDDWNGAAGVQFIIEDAAWADGRS